MLKPTEIYRVNKQTPTLAVMAVKPRHTAPGFALWEVQAEAVTAFKLSHTSHLQQTTVGKALPKDGKKIQKVRSENCSQQAV